ncbi:hypothetical protein SUNI508_09139 [Seiridium unicorne]|uniref:Septin-type G domain-containing protein n=1 Tax=Seiridium unicorne TaxID=138068 RepID=A0ABR2URD6_9PEZI
MRPLPGDDAFGRQRSADYDGVAAANPTANSQMSFFLADEDTVDSYLDQPSVGCSRLKDARKPAGQGHGLSLGKDDKSTDLSRSISRESERECDSMYSPFSAATLPSPTPMPASSHNHAPLSRPITPITLGTSVTGSLLSSPSSRRNSLGGSISENAVSSDEEDHAAEAERSTSNMGDSGSAPQLVMPSIKMPSRRPFTEIGKSLGRLKVLCAGKSGVGKTSLLKAIVQVCDHVVHVDPIVPHPGSRRSSKATTRPGLARRRSSDSTRAICEIFASTKPYPEWRTELDDLHSSQRRKSLGDQILDRNICFVDTPGYGTGSSAMESIIPCVEYVESHLNKVSSDALSESEMLNLLGGDGGYQVDVVLYMVDRNLSPADTEYLKRLSSLTNVIPLLAQADAMSSDERATCKEQIVAQLCEAGIRCFSFTPASALESSTDLPTIPYAVSSATESDHDVMDASLLMSPDYIQPLMSSELTVLVEHLFSANGSSWLRHSAAKKYMQWRDGLTSTRPKHLYQPLSLPVPAVTLDPGTGALIGRPPLTLARANHHNTNGSAPRIHIVDWAEVLQRSLANEKAQYETLTRGERAVWLTEKLNECVQDGTLVPSTHSKEKPYPACRRRRRGPTSRKASRHQDPLGLLQVVADLKAKGWIALEMLGGLGLLGGLAYWLAQQRWQTETVQTADDWARMWGFDI